MALKGDNFHESSEQKHKRCNAKVIILYIFLA